jgi:erythritol transport system ATP-binding protein
LEEVTALSDRILVMADGSVTGEFEKPFYAAEVIAAATPDKTREQAA